MTVVLDLLSLPVTSTAHCRVTGGEAKNVDQLRKELLKKDKGYRVLEPGESNRNPSTLCLFG